MGHAIILRSQGFISTGYSGVCLHKSVLSTLFLKHLVALEAGPPGFRVFEHLPVLPHPSKHVPEAFTPFLHSVGYGLVSQVPDLVEIGVLDEVLGSPLDLDSLDPLFPVFLPTNSAGHDTRCRGLLHLDGIP